MITPVKTRATGRPGMDLWKILILGTLRLNCNWDYDKVHEIYKRGGGRRFLLLLIHNHRIPAPEFRLKKTNTKSFHHDLLTINHLKKRKPSRVKRLVGIIHSRIIVNLTASYRK